MLTKENFGVESYANTIGEESLIGKYTIPRGRVLLFDSTKKMRLFLPVKESVDLGASGGRVNYSFTCAVPLADSPGRSVELEIFALWKGIRANVSNVNYNASGFDIAVDGTAGTLEVFYLPRVGGVRILAEAPDGIRSQEDFFNDQLAIVHQSNQISGTAIKPSQDFHLPERFKLAIYANVGAKVDLTKMNGIINIPFKSLGLDEWKEILLASAELTEVERVEAAGMSVRDIILKSWAEGGR